MSKRLKSQKPNARKNLAVSLKLTLEKLDIQVSDIANKTRTDRRNWYKRLNGYTDIKLIDILIICECSDTDVIDFLMEMNKKYYSEN